MQNEVAIKVRYILNLLAISNMVSYNHHELKLQPALEREQEDKSLCRLAKLSS